MYIYQDRNEKPLLHSKLIIFICSALLSPFFGAVLFIQNLLTVGKKKEVVQVIIFAFLWTFIANTVLNNLNVRDTTIRLFVPNVVGGFILIKLFWDYHLKDIQFYNKRKVWGPLAVVAFVYALIIGLNYLYRSN